MTPSGCLAPSTFALQPSVLHFDWVKCKISTKFTPPASNHFSLPKGPDLLYEANNRTRVCFFPGLKKISDFGLSYTLTYG